MKQILLFLAISCSIFTCKDTPKDAAGADAAETQTVLTDEQAAAKALADLVTIRGQLVQNAGRSGFRDYNAGTMYEVFDLTEKMDSMYNLAVAPRHFFSEYTFAVLRGKFQRKVGYGFDQFYIHQIDTIEAKSLDNMLSLGFPFEFWCHGTNPSWTIEISNASGGIFYENVNDNIAWFCPWWPATINSPTSWTYDVPAATGAITTGSLLIKIKKEKATDGSSDKEYDYSVEVLVEGNKKLKGVAVRGKAKVLGPDGRE